MDSESQAAGEARVRDLLVKPLLKRGLAKPGSLTRAQFEEMTGDLCARLAYMSPENLSALEEVAAGRPSGKDQDRFPIANKILEWAGQIEPPRDDASPLIRAVFNHPLGRDAVAAGWAPELLDELRRNRRWPSPFVVKTVRDTAEEQIRRLQDVERRIVRDGDVPPEQAAWRSRRLAMLDKCRRISEMAE